MGRARRRLSWLAGGWLIVQLVSLLLAPATLCAEAMALQATTACTCPHGDGGECPMHHRAANRPKNECSCHSNSTDDSAAMASLLGPVAVLPPAASAFEPVRFSQRLDRTTAVAPEQIVVPDSPPPRS